MKNWAKVLGVGAIGVGIGLALSEVLRRVGAVEDFIDPDWDDYDDDDCCQYCRGCSRGADDSDTKIYHGEAHHMPGQGFASGTDPFESGFESQEGFGEEPSDGVDEGTAFCPYHWDECTVGAEARAAGCDICPDVGSAACPGDPFAAHEGADESEEA